MGYLKQPAIIATNLIGAGIVTGMLGDIVKLKQGGKKNGKTLTSN